MAKLTLSLGSNLGDRTAHLAAARTQLAASLGGLIYESAIIETAAWGNTQQPDFLNQLVICDIHSLNESTALTYQLHHILDITQGIEHALGRVRSVHWGARTIDIDLIFLDELRYEDARLSLPHPWWRQRRFVTDLLPSSFDPYLRIYDLA
ncbi:Bifunctional folate synthesis protein [Neolewinella maritima]|uniref:2-amino-4-hydroxy-6-hydroxymethyldihydropteridine pyrophosphokinase n=1 Tax=Neolewinella maritima TaxID=1383882 RepID=A0ABM9B0A1_9BACT|nr:2-amino-4-hydroxy-6-hydroxymethyldihydropteridine diphosphokinase [Neolewinella maritima]CAH1000509.1 Bifunctional folate synthesis protein [Neolewinella maritima]